MHFWIDKRAQPYSFGRARVAHVSVSLSNAHGIGGPLHLRRARNKSAVVPIHRLQTIDCTNTTNSSNRPTHQINRNLHRSVQSNQRQSHYNNQLNCSNSFSSQPQHNSNNQTSARHLQSSNQHHLLQQQCVMPVANAVHVSLTNTYSGPSHSPELEHGALGIETLSSAPTVQSQRPHALVNHIPLQQIQQLSHQPESQQLLPSHLKFGMWASLALATVCVAGAKFYFDHQGTGFEVFIFCVFCASFLLAACTVSLCRRPRNSNLTPSITHEHVQTIDRTSTIPNSGTGDVIVNPAIPQQAVAPPPPYHIAILLPETSKDAMDEETPPPAYDKIVI